MSSYLDKKEGFNLNKPLNKLVKEGRAKEQKRKDGMGLLWGFSHKEPEVRRMKAKKKECWERWCDQWRKEKMAVCYKDGMCWYNVCYVMHDNVYTEWSSAIVFAHGYTVQPRWLVTRLRRNRDTSAMCKVGVSFVTEAHWPLSAVTKNCPTCV